MTQLLQRLWNQDEGQDIAEYAVMLPEKNYCPPWRPFFVRTVHQFPQSERVIRKGNRTKLKMSSRPQVPPTQFQRRRIQ